MRYEISGHFIFKNPFAEKLEIFNCSRFGEAVTLLGKKDHVKLGLIFLFFSYFFLRLVHLSGSAETEEVTLLIMFVVIEKSD